jgi:hypothetical protein
MENIKWLRHSLQLYNTVKLHCNVLHQRLWSQVCVKCLCTSVKETNWHRVLCHCCVCREAQNKSTVVQWGLSSLWKCLNNVSIDRPEMQVSAVSRYNLNSTKTFVYYVRTQVCRGKSRDLSRDWTLYNLTSCMWNCSLRLTKLEKNWLNVGLSEFISEVSLKTK